MELGDLWVESKLTEGGFGRAARQRLSRYSGIEEVFDVEELPWTGGSVSGYQIVRGILAAVRDQRRYVVLLDRRRADMEEVCFRVLRAVKDAEARSRFRLVTWQELASSLPRRLQQFLGEKYGIVSANGK